MMKPKYLEVNISNYLPKRFRKQIKHFNNVSVSSYEFQHNVLESRYVDIIALSQSVAKYFRILE